MFLQLPWIKTWSVNEAIPATNVANQSGSDLTPHVYQYTFASNPNWSRFYPPGPEFEEYLKGVAKKYDMYQKTKFGHRFQSAKWHEDIGQWEVTVLRTEDNTVSDTQSS